VSGLVLTHPTSAMRSPEQVSLDEWSDATAVWAYLAYGQRLLPLIRARVPLAAAKDVELWAREWQAIKGGLVWAGYDLQGLLHAAHGLAA